MKKIILILLSILLSSTLYAESFKDEDIIFSELFGVKFPYGLVFNESLIKIFTDGEAIKNYSDMNISTFEMIFIAPVNSPSVEIQIEAYNDSKIISINQCDIPRLTKGNPVKIDCQIESSSFDKVIVRIKKITIIED